MKSLVPILKSRRRRRIALLVAALLLTAAVAIPAAIVFAQEPPPGDELAFVNAEEEPVERKGDGRFIARPIFNHPVGPLCA